MNDYFIFDGVDSRTFGAYVFDVDTDSAPSPNWNTVTIPGKDGDFLLKNRRFPNVTHTYYVLFPTDFETGFSELRAFLLSRDGYCRLEDSIHPDEYWKAYVNTDIHPIITQDRSMGKAEITFTRKPQRFLKTGETDILVYGSGTKLYTITNPTRFASQPLITFIGEPLKGFNITVNGTQLNFKNTSPVGSHVDDNVHVDFETFQCYSSPVIYNHGGDMVYTYPTDYSKAFTLSPGNNTISYSSIANLSEIRITPRWYTI